MKIIPLPFVLLAMASAAIANTPPTVVIKSAVMRPGTTLMDVVYRVNDPDDATVRTRALAFVDGTRSFAKVLKPVTFVEDTATKLGNAIPANVDHSLTWNVSADWNIDLGQVKFEVLAMDQRGLLPFEWISIPAAGGQPAIKISKDTPTDPQVLNALFWQYASGDSGLSLNSGVLRGNSASGVFDNVKLASGTTVDAYGAAFIFKRMNLTPATSKEISFAIDARAGLLNTSNWHALDRPYSGMSILVGWGENGTDQITIPKGLSGVAAIAGGQTSTLLLMNSGKILQLGITHAVIPPDLSDLIAVSMGSRFRGLALKKDGTVVEWTTYVGESTAPAKLRGITAISSAMYYGLALNSNGTVSTWGGGSTDASVVPDLSGITAIAAGENLSIVMRSDGTVFGWPRNSSSTGYTPPVGLGGVTAISAGYSHGLALKSDGTVVAWGSNSEGQAKVPAALTGVRAISAGSEHSLALKSDGTVIVWGGGNYMTTIPAGLTGVIAIGAGWDHNLALKSEGP